MDPNKKKRVVILSTGGTIEKTYDESVGSLENRGSAILKRLQRKLRLPYTDIEVHAVMSKDSLELTDQDRAFIADRIKDWSAQGCALVILHGTDTLDRTVRYCQKALPDIPVPVVFTGAMKPQELENSDAVQNVTESLLAAKFLPKGFYVVFHNRVFRDVSHLRKNYTWMTFESH